ncbi:MAG: type IV pilus twitching motility protein PilT, partial [Telluria sp.]
MERDQASKFMFDLLRLMVSKGGSDLFITAGFPPAMKLDGKMTPVSNQALTSQHTADLARSIMNDKQTAGFELTKEANFAISPGDLGRFRVSAFVQMGAVGMVLRVITTTIPKLEDLNLPSVLKDVIMTKRGLVIMVGATGSGKSTTLAAMVDYCNRNRKDHILTIEDPIEFVHESKNSLVNHREVGVHTKGFSAALRGALREDPDIILVGELRDLETIELALTAASTGHLVFGTLHTPSAAKTVDRIIDVFPADQQNKIRATLSEALKGVVAQNLFKRIDKKGRVAALEVLVFNTAVAN